MATPQYGAYNNDPEKNRLLGMAGNAGEGFAGAQTAQRGALGMYRDMAEGNGPSVAQEQLRSQGEANAAQQMQLMGSARGGNLQSAMRQGAVAGTAAQAATNQQMGQLRAQEQQAAMAGYAGLGSTMAGQSLQQQGLFEGQLGQAHTAQMDAEMRQRMLDEQRRQFNKQQALRWTQFGTGAAGQVIGGILGTGGAAGG